MIISKAMNTLFDGLTAPFAGHDTLALIFVSVLTGVLMLLLFKWTTRQSVLSTARGRLTGHLYELGLYQDDLGVMARIQKDLLVANLKYVALTLPALVVLVPMAVVVLVQLEARYQHDPLGPGDTLMLSATLSPENRGLIGDLSLEPGTGLAVDAAPVRDAHEGRIWWRLRVTGEGRLEAAVVDGRGGRWTLPVKAAESARPYSPKRFQSGFWASLMSPASVPLPAVSPLATLDLRADEADPWYVRGWFWIFCAASILGGLAFKKVLRVEI